MSLRGQRYLDFLQTEPLSLLTDTFPNENENIWCHQDGVPPHFARHVRDFINICFPVRWID